MLRIATSLIKMSPSPQLFTEDVPGRCCFHPKLVKDSGEFEGDSCVVEKLKFDVGMLKWAMVVSEETSHLFEGPGLETYPKPIAVVVAEKCSILGVIPSCNTQRIEYLQSTGCASRPSRAEAIAKEPRPSCGPFCLMFGFFVAKLSDGKMHTRRWDNLVEGSRILLIVILDMYVPTAI